MAGCGDRCGRAVGRAATNEPLPGCVPSPTHRASVPSPTHRASVPSPTHRATCEQCHHAAAVGPVSHGPLPQRSSSSGRSSRRGWRSRRVRSGRRNTSSSRHCLAATANRALHQQRKHGRVSAPSRPAQAGLKPSAIAWRGVWGDRKAAARQLMTRVDQPARRGVEATHRWADSPCVRSAPADTHTHTGHTHARTTTT